MICDKAIATRMIATMARIGPRQKILAMPMIIEVVAKLPLCGFKELGGGGGCHAGCAGCAVGTCAPPTGPAEGRFHAPRSMEVATGGGVLSIVGKGSLVTP